MKSNHQGAAKVGVTGGIGAGKTTVCKIIESLGYPIFYADIEAKNIMTSNPDIIAQIVRLFGADAYQNGEMNKFHLSKVVFNNPSLLSELNNLVHPEVRLSFDAFAKKHQDKKLVFNEAAILFETGAYKTFDYTVLVTAPKSLRIQRVSQRDQVANEHVENRMKNQWDDAKKIPLADFVILNDGQTDLNQSIRDILQQLLKRSEQKNKDSK